MIDQHFLSPSTATHVFGPLQGGERVMWHGRCGVAEYAFDQAASMPRWTLPENTEVLVTDRRVRYSHTSEETGQVRSGELRWLWPQHLRVQPGARSRDRGAAATQIQLVCGGDDGTYPALVLAGGDLATVGDADRLANIMRQSIARFRVDNAEKLGLTSEQMRMLARLLMGPEFRNHQGGEGQTASLLGALLVSRPTPAVELPAEEAEQAAPVGQGTRLINYRPGRAADAARALLAVRAEQEAHRAEPEVASRAADLAARIADLVSQTAPPEPQSTEADRQWPKPERHWAEPERQWQDPEPERQWPSPEPERQWPSPEPERQWPSPEPGRQWAEPEPQWAPEPAPRHARKGHAEPRLPEDFDVPTTNLAERADRIRKTAARMAANSARWKVGIRREPGISTRGGKKH